MGKIVTGDSACDGSRGCDGTRGQRCTLPCSNGRENAYDVLALTSMNNMVQVTRHATRKREVDVSNIELHSS